MGKAALMQDIQDKLYVRAHLGARKICRFKTRKGRALPNLTSFLNTSLLFLASSLEVSASAVLGFFDV